jgi:hypothetical protein
MIGGKTIANQPLVLFSKVNWQWDESRIRFSAGGKKLFFTTILNQIDTEE